MRQIISGENDVRENGVSEREATIVRTSIIGIGANVLLAAFKAVIGTMTDSIAIIMDLSLIHI